MGFLHDCSSLILSVRMDGWAQMPTNWYLEPGGSPFGREKKEKRFASVKSKALSLENE